MNSHQQGRISPIHRLLPIFAAFLLGIGFLWVLQNVDRLRPIVSRVGSSVSSTSTTQHAECVENEAALAHQAPGSCACPIDMNSGQGTWMNCLIVNRLGVLRSLDVRAVDGGVSLQLLNPERVPVGSYGLIGAYNPYPREGTVLPARFATNVSRIQKLDEVTYLVTLSNPNNLNVPGLAGVNYLRFLRVSFSPLKIEPLTERDVVGLNYNDHYGYSEYVFDTGPDVKNPRFILSRLNSVETRPEPSTNLQAVVDITDQLRAIGLLPRILRDESMGLAVEPEDESNNSFILRYFYIGLGDINERYRINISSSTNPVITKLKNVPYSKTWSS